MGIFEYEDKDILGTVESVDTTTVMVKIENDELLLNLQINNLVALQSSLAGDYIIDPFSHELFAPK